LGEDALSGAGERALAGGFAVGADRAAAADDLPVEAGCRRSRSGRAYYCIEVLAVPVAGVSDGGGLSLAAVAKCQLGPECRPSDEVSYVPWNEGAPRQPV